MKQLEELFISLGYSKDDYNEIINAYALTNLKEDTLFNNVKRNFDYFIRLGYKREEVIKMTKTLPSIYSLSIENIKEKLEFYDSNPYILNLEVFEIEKYINTRKNNGELLEDIIDDLDSNPYLFNEI